MFSRLASAMINEQERHMGAKEMSDAVLASIPEDPERGSYYWWARICREFTGTHFLDSGIMFGYQFQRPVKPEFASQMYLTMHDGKPEGVTINLIKWLRAMFDATDEVAIAIEDVLNWVGIWLFPRESWLDVSRNFPGVLELLEGCISRRGEGLIFHKAPWNKGENLRDIVGNKYRGMTYKHEFQSWQEDLSEDEFVSRALKAFPVKAIKFIYEEGLEATDDGTFYTYNHENDLSQDFSADLFFREKGCGGDIYNNQYVVLRTHNGADARGGLSSPVVAAIRDASYMFSWQADFYCRGCHSGWESGYSYTKDLGATEMPLIFFNLAKGILARVDKSRNGQLTLDGSLPTWDLDVPEDQIRALLEVINEDDLQLPYVICHSELHIIPPDSKIICSDRGHTWVPDLDGYDTVPDSLIDGLLCPKCGKHLVMFSSMVYGF